MANSSFFLNQLDSMPDPFRTTRWKFYIGADIFNATGINPTNADSFGTVSGQDEFSLHLKTAHVPGISTETKSLDYMGFHSWYVTNTETKFEQELEAIFLENVAAWEMIYSWNQNLLNTGVLIDGSDADRVGQSGLPLGLGTHKLTSPIAKNKSCRLELLNWMDGQLLVRINLINAQVIKIGDMPLNYSTPELARFKFTLKSDRFTIYINKPYMTGKGLGTNASTT